MYYLKVKDSGKYFVGGYKSVPADIGTFPVYGNIKVPVLTDKPTAFFNRETAIRHLKTYALERFKSKYTSLDRPGYATMGEIYLLDTSDSFPDIEFLINDEVISIDIPPMDKRARFSFWLKVSGIDSDDVSSIMMSMQAAEIRGKPCDMFAKVMAQGIGDRSVFRDFCDQNRFQYPPAGAVPRITATGWGVCTSDDLALMKLSLERNEEVYYLDVNYDAFEFPVVSPKDIRKFSPVRLSSKSKKL